MTGWSQHVATAFALGFALGAAPGPVQVLILAETAKRGFSGGLRVMLGANGTLLAIVLALALGFSSFTPGETLLRTLRLVGGVFLVYLAVAELRSLRERGQPASGVATRSLGPTAKGVVSVLVNPGAWIFFATTASAVIASATAGGGRTAAIVAAGSMAAGVSVSDTGVTLLGSGGRAVLGERVLRWVRVVLSLALLALGIAFVLRGAGLV